MIKEVEKVEVIPLVIRTLETAIESMTKRTKLIELESSNKFWTAYEEEDYP